MKYEAYMKSLQKEPSDKRCLLILDWKPFRSQVKGKPSTGSLENLSVQGKKLLTQTSLQDLGIVTKNHAIYQINQQISLKNKEVEPVGPVQVNIYQSNTYRKHLSRQHFIDGPRVPERQLVKDQQSYISVFLAYLRIPRRNQQQHPRHCNSVPYMDV